MSKAKEQVDLPGSVKLLKVTRDKLMKLATERDRANQALADAVEYEQAQEAERIGISLEEFQQAYNLTDLNVGFVLNKGGEPAPASVPAQPVIENPVVNDEAGEEKGGQDILDGHGILNGVAAPAVADALLSE